MTGEKPTYSMFDNFTTKGTQLMAIYTPYFYIIQDTRNGMYYAGAKWAQGCHPDQLLKEGGYPTSSETIKKIIDENGLDTFVIRKIRTFETGGKAYDYETRFLVKVDARNNPSFYNCHNNDGCFPSYGSFEFKQIMLHMYGIEHPSHSQEFLSKKSQNNLEKYGAENPFQMDFVKDKMKETNLRLYGSKNVMGSEIIQEKRRIGFQQKYGVDHYSQTDEYKVKVAETTLERYGVDHYTKTDEFKEYIRKNSLEKYGVEHHWKSEDVKETIRQSNRERYGADYYTQTDEYKARRKVSGKRLASRPEANKIREIQKRNKISLSPGWYQKDTDILLMMLEGLDKIEDLLRTGVSKSKISELDLGFKFRLK